MSRQTCDLPPCENFAVSFDDLDGFRCDVHAPSVQEVTP